MKKIVFLLFVLFVTTNVFAKELQWKQFQAGIAEAKKSGKVILVDVFTDWCKWCKKMDAETYTDKKVKEYLESKFVIIKLNAEGSENITYSGQKISPPQFAQQMGITGYPATLFLKKNGEPITVLPGYSEPGMFIHVLSFIAEHQYEKKSFDKYLAEKGVK